MVLAAPRGRRPQEKSKPSAATADSKVACSAARRAGSSSGASWIPGSAGPSPEG
jgi:hypothetical protein